MLQRLFTDGYYRTISKLGNISFCKVVLGLSTSNFSNIATEQMLYSESDLEASMDKIETINFHEEKDILGVKFWAYNAGHVLGAAMFMIEIAGVKVDIVVKIKRRYYSVLCSFRYCILATSQGKKIGI